MMLARISPLTAPSSKLWFFSASFISGRISQLVTPKSPRPTSCQLSSISKKNTFLKYGSHWLSLGHLPIPEPIVTRTRLCSHWSDHDLMLTLGVGSPIQMGHQSHPSYTEKGGSPNKRVVPQIKTTITKRRGMACRADANTTRLLHRPASWVCDLCSVDRAWP